MGLAARPALVVAAVLWLATMPAQAQPANREEARREFEKGRVAYDVADYDQAITHFTRAYELSLEPVLIFNIAQAQRKVGRCHKAIELYQKYLRLAPATEEAEAARAHLEVLQKSCPEEAPPETAPPKPAPAAAVQPPAPPPPPAPKRPGLRTAAWVGLAGGVLVGASSPLLYQWNQSRKPRRDVEAAALERVLPTDAADPDARMRLEQSNRALSSSIDTVDTLVIVTAVAGTAMALGSAGYLMFAGRPERPAEPHAGLGVSIGPGLALLAVSGRY